MRGVQIVSLKSVQGLKAHLSLPQTALNFELLPAVLRRALVRRSRTRRTARVPWLIPVQLTSRCGPQLERPTLTSDVGRVVVGASAAPAREPRAAWV